MEPGINELVEALLLEDNVEVVIVAPKFNQSGSSDQTSPFNELSEEAASTVPGNRPATAIASSDMTGPRNGSGSPADAVRWALIQQDLSPDLVISGTNTGQNVGPASTLSGTVGAARTARRMAVLAIATSTGFGSPPDYATAVDKTMTLFNEWRLGERPNTLITVHSINIPTCEVGFSLRGTIESVLTVGGCVPQNNDWISASCNPNTNNPVVEIVDGQTDVEAFHNGYVSIADVGSANASMCTP